MTVGLRIRHLTFHGPTREVASVEFGPGLNLIYETYLRESGTTESCWGLKLSMATLSPCRGVLMEVTFAYFPASISARHRLMSTVVIWRTSTVIET